MNEAIRYAFLSDWVKEATQEEIIEKLIEHDERAKEIKRLNNIISQIETLVINHNCDTGDIYYKYNGKYLKSELKERIIELVELKEENK